MTLSSDVPTGRLSIAIAIVGFGAVATAQATNMILARANGGYIPPFTLAFFRWVIVALGLLPLSFAELHIHQKAVRSQWWQILITGFLGMFVCGGPIYIAGVTTTAINIGFIMAMSPIASVLLSSLVLRESPDVAQIAGGGLILAGMWLGLRKGEARDR
jgi:drug/metabolite transporter (DMT)-like permease